MSRWKMALGDAWRNFWITVRNLRRRLSRRPIDYVLLEVYGHLPEHVPPPPLWRRLIPIPGLFGDADSLSLAAVRAALERLADDPRPRGVVLRLDGLGVGWATAQSLRQAILRFRQSGKRALAYAEDFDTLTYFIACAADEIVAPPVAGWMVVGLRAEAMFIKRALDELGVEADAIAVAPYKTAVDAFTREEMSPEHRETLERLLDGHYEELVTAVAEGRGLAPESVRALIDRAPLTAAEAQQEGLLDGTPYLDELPDHLAGQAAEGEKPRLDPWPRVWRRLLEPARWRSGKVIGVVTLEGVIVPGFSRRLPLPFPVPFIGNVQAGAETVAKTLRRAENDPSVAGIVFHVDSRGGSTLASDLIWREVARIRRKKPVVVYMGDNAASGGYYVAADADWIVAQPLTYTGSIGVFLFKPVTARLFERLGVKRVSLQRGAHADLFADDRHFSADGLEAVRKYVFDQYARFKQRVTERRGIAPEKLDSLAGGRVWLGREALAHGLVDELGDLETALAKARQLAGVDPERWTPAVWITPTRELVLPGPIPPQPFNALAWLEPLLREEAWMLMPYEVRVRQVR